MSSVPEASAVLDETPSVARAAAEVATVLSDIKDAPLSHEFDLPDVFRRVSHPKKLAFLIALTATPNLGAACLAVGMTRRTLSNWHAKKDEDFEAAFKVAREIGISVAEDEAWRRATDGTVEDVYGSLGMNQGSGVVGQKRVRSDGMLMFLLKAVKPEVYRERVEHTGADGGPILTVHRVVREIAEPSEVIDALEAAPEDR